VSGEPQGEYGLTMRAGRNTHKTGTTRVPIAISSIRTLANIWIILSKREATNLVTWEEMQTSCQPHIGC